MSDYLPINEGNIRLSKEMPNFRTSFHIRHKVKPLEILATKTNLVLGSPLIDVVAERLDPKSVGNTERRAGVKFSFFGDSSCFVYAVSYIQLIAKYLHMGPVLFVTATDSNGGCPPPHISDRSISIEISAPPIVFEIVGDSFKDFTGGFSRFRLISLGYEVGCEFRVSQLYRSTWPSSFILNVNKTPCSRFKKCRSIFNSVGLKASQYHFLGMHIPISPEHSQDISRFRGLDLFEGGGANVRLPCEVFSSESGTDKAIGNCHTNARQAEFFATMYYGSRASFQTGGTYFGSKRGVIVNQELVFFDGKRNVHRNIYTES